MPLTLSIANISADPRDAISRGASLIASLGEPRLHLDATMPGLRPRELDRSGRRDLAAMLKRQSVMATGLDLFLPPQHLAETAHVDRAVGAITGAIELLSELSGLFVLESKALCLSLPAKPIANAMEAIASSALERGVTIADFSLPPAADVPASIACGVDCSQAIAAGQDPALLVSSGSPSAVRLCDWDGSRRVAAGEGRLDVQGLVVAVSISVPRVPVVIDLRGIGDAGRGGSGAADSRWESATRSSVEAWKSAIAGG